jgi:4-diphosphocytidyl-2-C-methyl-D-erythritol kinase
LEKRPLTAEASQAFYNALEAPVLEKYPLLALIKSYLKDQGAPVALMSGSGSTVFAILPEACDANALEKKVRDKFAPIWTCVAAI